MLCQLLNTGTPGQLLALQSPVSFTGTFASTFYTHSLSHTHTNTLARASMRGRAMLDPVPRATSRTVDQTPPKERVGAGAFTVWANAAWSAFGAGLAN
jgi:hypothetical protein